ncbi:MAG: glycerate kinase [Microscillaceae bacterium]|jgi:glycerate kinase|nr:glycerate kinase [Microscillaceae bacterium]
MKILVAPDKFKDSLSALQVSELIKEGLLAANAQFVVDIFPLADGGEGTAEILTYHSGGQLLKKIVKDPLFRPIEAKYGISADQQTAFVEMAQASGLVHLEDWERNPMNTSSYGTGELILAAIEQGAKTIILGIGGSATNDAGIGMAQALGYEFLDQNDHRLLPTGGNLPKIRRVLTQNIHPKLAKTQFIVATDVKNPLFGKNGAAYVYAPQKGAKPTEIAYLDGGLRNIAQVIENQFNMQVSDWAGAGAGAAGGLGAGAVAFLGATLQSGIELVMNFTKFEQKTLDYQWIITGEGKIDEQTLQGKVVAGVCRVAQKQQIPVAAVCGSLEFKPLIIKELALKYLESIITHPLTLSEAIAQADKNLIDWAFRFGKLIEK